MKGFLLTGLALFLAAGAASAQTIDVDEQRTTPVAHR